MSGLIGKKIGMTSIFDENGKNIPCTIIEAGPCVVTQVRTKEVDGYDALQLGFDDKAEKRATKAELGHFKKAGSSVKKKVIEFQGFEDNYKLGDTITVDFFAEGEFVDVSGISKGKGFQGVVKRWGFGGGRASHGSKFHREPGSTGQCTSPGRSFKNVKMPGHMGAERVTVQNLRIEKIDPELGVVMVRGSVPGKKDAVIFLRSAVKREK